jgi:thiamine-monophosphate kinase
MVKISDIGEFGLINEIKKMVGRASKNRASVIKGVGDDCAVVGFDKDRYLLLSCDTLIEGIDFLKDTSPFLIGRKALAVSISDIAAMGGLPAYALVSLGLRKDFSLKRVKELYRGILALSREFKVEVIGGDISASDKLMISITLLGFVEKKYVVYRSGSEGGDYIFVSGFLGGSINKKHLTFNPRIKEARYLVRNYKVHSMIDISDGLLQDLGHITTASNTGAVLYEDLIPMDKCAGSLEDALTWGEDFELLFTLSFKEARRLLRKRKTRGLAQFRMIGEITARKNDIRLVRHNAEVKIIKPQGFRHF